jgi:hypothetical protein
MPWLEVIAKRRGEGKKATMAGRSGKVRRKNNGGY